MTLESESIKTASLHSRSGESGGATQLVAAQTPPFKVAETPRSSSSRSRNSSTFSRLPGSTEGAARPFGAASDRTSRPLLQIIGDPPPDHLRSERACEKGWRATRPRTRSCTRSAAFRHPSARPPPEPSRRAARPDARSRASRAPEPALRVERPARLGAASQAPAHLRKGAAQIGQHARSAGLAQER